MINPYAGVNWGTVQRVVSASHMHIPDQDSFENAYTNGGIRHFPISNYYPSAPTYPLDNPVWPVEFTDIPLDVLGMPNAEHHSFVGEKGRLHLTTPGSTLVSGSPVSQEPLGYAGLLKDFCADVAASLQFPGGVIINHPKWSLLSVYDLISIIDRHRDIVLGIEIYNHTSATDTRMGETEREPSYDQWDALLTTGRHVLGFWVPDHALQIYTETDWHDAPGKSILLVDSVTEQNCATAYKLGAFYGMMLLSTLAFTNIDATETGITVETNESAEITLKTEVGTYAQVASGTTITAEWAANEKPIFIRAEAKNAGGEIYSQPIQYKTRADFQREKKRKMQRILIL